MIKIDSIRPTIITDSRGEKTVEVEIETTANRTKASVPCGKSKGKFEAFCHPAQVSIGLVEKIIPEIVGKNFADQNDFDSFLLKLDGTSTKANLGVNVTLSLSVAFCRLAAAEEKLELFQLLSRLAEVEKRNFPLLFFNLINGGLHVEKKFKPLPFQEYLVIPKETSPKKATDQIFEFIEGLKICLEERSCPLIYGDEGGFIFSGEQPKNGFEILADNLIKKGPNFAQNFHFGLDAATSSLWQNTDSYTWENQRWSADELKNIYHHLIDSYPILSIEDPFSQESWSEWTKFNLAYGKQVWVVGDDLTVTNSERMKKAHELACLNSIIIKPNQIGTVSETIDAIKLARSFGWKVIVSHRSGETNDDFIADLAYGVAADGLKAGSPLQHERLVKYNRLIAIERSIS